MVHNFFQRCEDNINIPFKRRKSLESRKEEVNGIQQRFPSKVPVCSKVIVERYSKEKVLPRLDKMKFLVPQELQMAKFVAVIRNRMRVSQTQSFYMIINNKTLVSMTKTMTEVYRENKDEDGFLYITYASQEMFG